MSKGKSYKAGLNLFAFSFPLSYSACSTGHTVVFRLCLLSRPRPPLPARPYRLHPYNRITCDHAVVRATRGKIKARDAAGQQQLARYVTGPFAESKFLSLISMDSKVRCSAFACWARWWWPSQALESGDDDGFIEIIRSHRVRDDHAAGQ